MRSRYKQILNFIQRNWRRTFILITLCFDYSSILLSAITAYYLRLLIPKAPVLDYIFFIKFTIFYATIIFIFNLLIGLYRSAYRLNTRQQFFLASKAYFFSVVIILSTLYIFQFTTFPRRFTFIFLTLYPVYYTLGRLLLRRFNLVMQKLNLGIYSSLIIHWNNGGKEVVKRFTKFPELGYRIKGVISSNGFSKYYQPSFKPSELESVIKSEKIDTLIILNDDIERLFDLSKDLVQHELANITKLCEKYRIKLKLISPEAESILRFVHIRDIVGIPLYIPQAWRINKLKKIIKRIFDFIATIFIILALSPIFILTTLAILIEDGRPIFFKQRRALVKGKNEFYFYKFRSMVKDAEAKQEELYKRNLVTGGLFMMDKDPRITKVGKFIRRYSIDELPQLLNVLRGEMSLVGPRPLSIADLSNISEENSLGGYYVLRDNTKPGVTGLWQISGRRTVSFKEMVLLDLYYIENQSLFLDLEVLFETIPVVVFGKGGY